MTKDISLIEFAQLLQYFEDGDLKLVSSIISDEMIEKAILNKKKYLSDSLNKNEEHKLKYPNLFKSIKSRSNIYLIKNNRNGYIKIGKSSNPKKREKTLQSEEPELELIFTLNASLLTETELHIKFNSKRVRGEWFNLTDEDVNYIKSLNTNEQ